MPELKPGDRYLYIEQTGHNAIRAFPNTAKKSPKEPDFKANGKSGIVEKRKVFGCHNKQLCLFYRYFFFFTRSQGCCLGQH